MHSTNFKSDMRSRVDDAIEKKRAADAAWRKVCKAVDARDHRACRATGKKTNPDAVGLLRGHRHHIVYRSAGGENTTANLVTLSAEAHNDEHQGRLQIVVLDSKLGADGPLEFWRKGEDDQWYLSRREIAIGRPERD